MSTTPEITRPPLSPAAQAVLARRFWSKVDSSDPDGCWPWRARIGTSGYGMFRHQGRPINAQRIAWILTYGPIPRHPSAHGMCVLHRCDNRACVKPTHLFLGTQADNLADMHAKGRRVYHGSRGSKNPNARVTPTHLHRIRQLRDFGLSMPRIARNVGLSASTVSRIISGDHWITRRAG